MRRSWRIAGCGAALAMGLACSQYGTGSDPEGENGLITLRLTGASTAAVEGVSAAPPGADLIASATVEIGAVNLVGGDDGMVTLTDAGGTFDLLDLQNGVDATLASVEVPAGTYSQLRLVVLGASVTLVDGTTFDDGSSTQDLKVPSGSRSGIKIQLDDGDDEPGLTVVAGETIMLLEFDVGRNFVLTGPPGAPRKALFTPSVRVVMAEE